MDLEIRYQLRSELASRGFRGAMAPNGTMALEDEYLSSVGVRDLMAQLVLRREQVFGLVGVVGLAEAKKGYDDISAAIEAIKVIVERLESQT